MAEQPVTDFIQPSEDLTDFAAERLSSYGQWNVCRLPGSDPEMLFEYLPDLKLPAAVVIYSSSSYGSNPRRTSKIEVLIVADAVSASLGGSLRELVDKAVSLIDNQISEHAIFCAESDACRPISPTVSAYSVIFRVEDH